MPKIKQAAILDIGSEKMTVLAGGHGINNTINIKGFGESLYSGFAGGEFLEPQKLLRAVTRAIEQAEENMKSRIKELYIGVPSEFCKVRVKECAISFKLRRKVNEIDVQELYLDAPQIDNYTQIGGKPVYYTLDGGNKTLSPVGSSCSQLQGLLSFYYADNRFINTFTGMLESLGIKVKFICAFLAECGVLFDDKQKKYLLADIGYITTGVGLYQGDGLLFLNSFSAGGAHIAADLMECLHISFDLAQKLKEQIKLNLEVEEDDKYKIEINDESCEVPMKLSHEIVSARIEQMGTLINGLIKESGTDIPSYIPLFLSGGGISYMRGAAAELSKVLDRNVEVAAPFLPKLNKPHMSSSVGVLEYALNDIEKQKKGFWARLFS
jgi:cell division protein FtsA